jgi:hypothetical protein
LATKEGDMDESGSRYILGKPEDSDEHAHAPLELLSEEDRLARVMKIIEAFGTVEYDPDYDYKEQRRRGTLKLEKLRPECDDDISIENIESLLKAYKKPT